jgi:transcription termination factor Rho
MREKRVKHERIIYKNKQTAMVELGLKRQVDEERLLEAMRVEPSKNRRMMVR